MKIVRCLAITAFYIAFNLHAQSSATAPASPPPVSGSTMEQTIAFMNQALVTRGEISLKPHERIISQSVTLENACSLVDRSEVVHQYPTDESSWPDSSKA
ncbi:hypothetical protein FTO74_10660 [Granulicella sp. WH15]|uniref:hypothetical protein n=1 Tax=Granulicella sp. WH15 TaxID=2602070 RepID=UPI00136727E9|nr:hypothetical protein [Granulicella sp. WH15]QHN03782.1 hypothetical protein FTO74_10660 [Granulicella sp. WH15]